MLLPCLEILNLKPIFHQNANPLALGWFALLFLCYPPYQHEWFANQPTPTCWYPKTLSHPTRTITHPTRAPTHVHSMCLIFVCVGYSMATLLLVEYRLKTRPDSNNNVLTSGHPKKKVCFLSSGWPKLWPAGRPQKKNFLLFFFFGGGGGGG